MQATQTPAITDSQHEQALRRHLEDRERLLFTSRTLSVTEMASTLAHELNQPIGTVANVLRGLKMRLEAAKDGLPHQGLSSPDGSSPEALIAGVQFALDQALFAGKIISRIREYTHVRQPRKEALDLIEVVRESLSLLDWEIQRDNVCVHIEMPVMPCRIVGDEVMLQQVFVNLLRNALEAMRGDDVAPRSLRIALIVEPNVREAALTIRDSGCGLPPDAQQRLFVPFQSTKPNGMGIGLNICRSFVELHQGRLWFTRNESDSPAEPGSTFHVVLPLRA
ncbi:MAG TPA: sensor histidine kinase [Burkholderiaceae bacterium]|nr:sensor histidine kinase [Burkholderiaceae bacterium]